MKLAAVLTCAMVAFAFGAAHADVFRCIGTDGKTVYQETPCVTGNQNTIDDRDARQRDQVAQERKADEEDQRKQTSDFRKQWENCKAKNDCVDFC